jgi:hypothetical protein
MDLIDTLFVNKPESEPIPVTQQYGKANNIMNLRDNKGRTPLHMAIAFNNKESMEALLNLGASPHIEDAYGQRPIDICYNDGLRLLLEAKMSQMKKPAKTQDIVPGKAGSELGKS